jgi:hypothetical protein
VEVDDDDDTICEVVPSLGQQYVHKYVASECEKLLYRMVSIRS